MDNNQNNFNQPGQEGFDQYQQQQSGGLVSYGYDANGNPVSDPSLAVYDANGMMINQNQYDQNQQQEYDQYGNPVGMLPVGNDQYDPNQMQYDEYGNPVGMLPGGNDQYDPNQMQYDEYGNPVGMLPGGNDQYDPNQMQYDEYGNPVGMLPGGNDQYDQGYDQNQGEYDQYNQDQQWDNYDQANNQLAVVDSNYEEKQQVEADEEPTHEKDLRDFLNSNSGTELVSYYDEEDEVKSRSKKKQAQAPQTRGLLPELATVNQPDQTPITPHLEAKPTYDESEELGSDDDINLSQGELVNQDEEEGVINIPFEDIESALLPKFEEIRKNNLQEIEKFKLEAAENFKMLQRANEELKSSNDQLKSTNEQLRSSNESLEDSNKRIETQLQTLLESINEMRTKTHQPSEEEVSSRSKLEKRLEELAEKLDQTKEIIDESKENSKETKQTFEQSNHQLIDSFEKKIQLLTEKLNQTQESFNYSQKAKQEQDKEFAQKIEKIIEQTKQANDSLQNHVKESSQNLEGKLDNKFEVFADKLTEITSKKISEKINQQQAAKKEEMSNLQSSLQNSLQKALSEVVSKVENYANQSQLQSQHLNQTLSYQQQQINNSLRQSAQMAQMNQMPPQQMMMGMNNPYGFANPQMMMPPVHQYQQLPPPPAPAQVVNNPFQLPNENPTLFEKLMLANMFKQTINPPQPQALPQPQSQQLPPQILALPPTVVQQPNYLVPQPPRHNDYYSNRLNERMMLDDAYNTGYDEAVYELENQYYPPAYEYPEYEEIQPSFRRRGGRAKFDPYNNR
ncbi:fibronectin-binding protein [[Mycoplasma] imitans]|uniref:fibronectin-binding protein n=1 Tax=[Mycoplasma] imitans TaxID=29560 RepID=UPI000485BEDF|nr:fibronectin-binding protein [[Mycoplasma] imitans]